MGSVVLPNDMDNLSRELAQEVYGTALVPPSGKLSYPSHIKLIMETPFAQPSLQHSFTVGKTIYHIVIFLFKNVWLSNCNSDALCTAFPAMGTMK